MSGVTQDAFPPFTCKCLACGLVWTPEPARGKREATESSIEREVRAHFRACPGEPRKESEESSV